VAQQGCWSASACVVSSAARIVFSAARIVAEGQWAASVWNRAAVRHLASNFFGAKTISFFISGLAV
jgi:hypothetical protein